MDLPSLELKIIALEKSLDSWEFWLTVATLLVVVGLVLEYWHEVRELLKARPVKWKSVRQIIGAIFVTVGVAGELSVQYKASTVETKLRAASHAVESILNASAESAKSTAAGFQGQIADAEARAAEARAMAAAEQLERIKLEAIVTPRSLSLGQQRLIKAALSRFSGHPAVIVSSYGLDLEGAALGVQLISVIGSATGTAPVDRTAGPIVAGGFETGVQIRGPKSEQEFMSALASALTSIGKLKEVAVNGPSVRPGTTITAGVSMAPGTAITGAREIVPAYVPAVGPVSIMVGIKPLPVLDQPAQR
jgi:hypothetical protein